MKCSKGFDNCNIKPVAFNPWLLYNERVVDFINWKEIIPLFVVWSFAYALVGLVLSIPLTALIDYLMKSSGALFSPDNEREPVIKYKKCSTGKCNKCAIIQH